MSDREENAIQNVRAFSVFAAGKLPPHVVEDLRIVCTLAAIAAATRRAKTPKAVECEASQSGGKAASPNPSQDTSPPSKDET
jgi:hypothetical protein